MNFRNLFLQAILVAIFFGFWGTANAAVRFGASGSWSKSYLGLQTQTMDSYKGSLSVDLGSYFRVGYSYRRTYQHREGYADINTDETIEEYAYFEQDVIQDAHSLDFFAILYAGEIVTPYIFVGGAVKFFEFKDKNADEPSTSQKAGPQLVPNYGVGLAIALNKDFSLKITNTWSDSLSKNLEGKPRKMRDTQFDVGLSYAI